jgi:hypothetical protein
MYGSSMGTLNVNTINSAGEEENIFTRSGSAIYRVHYINLTNLNVGTMWLLDGAMVG